MNLKNLKVSINQMKVIPGRPDLNARYMIGQIEIAVENKVDILVFPEMCVPGYLIGDLYEDDCFGRDVGLRNFQVIRAVPEGLTVIFGTLLFNKDDKNEDGRLRKHNAALIASGGQIVGVTFKTLQPNYRIFDDDRHFYGFRKVAESINIDNSGGQLFDIRAIISNPIEIKTRFGNLQLGVILCEDMWCEDYNLNPTKILVDKGADIIFNLSASPWTWRKNQKRHQVVRGLLNDSPVPFVYVNNTGVQNNGKNIVVFDGSSTIYDKQGQIIFSVPPYQSGSYDFIFPDLDKKRARKNVDLMELKFSSLAEQIKFDADELYRGWECAVRETFASLPTSMRKAVIGISGGIDSAVTATLIAKILGPENVYGINMPSQYNSQATKDIAQRLATNLGINYEVRPIGEIVDAICQATGTVVDSLSYENVQARARMEILAARTQDLGGVFICNANKVEAAFGYGTLYGDIAGFMAPLGDMLKREVYQMGDYLNRMVYQWEVIPRECFEIKPSAELKNKQTDPFHYGNLERRGYHDELVRAFVEFRHNPELILQHYIKKTLEAEFKLEPGTLAELFKTPMDFIVDLEENYRRFINSYFKRVQCVPIPILSKRAFGYDLRESSLSPFFTSRYYDLRKLLLSQDVPRLRIAIFGGSFNPACKHHQAIVSILREDFDLVMVVPCGSNRSDKDSVKIISNEQRARIAQLAFDGILGVQLDLSDLENNVYTPTYLLEERYKSKYPGTEIWHVVGGDLVHGGKYDKSEIQRSWQHGFEIWQNLNFCVIVRPGYELDLADLPINSMVIEIPKLFGSGTMAREMIKNGEDASALVAEDVLNYISEQHLYGS
jgi:NAD+ synthase (glutamine-hydrolysing)